MTLKRKKFTAPLPANPAVLDSSWRQTKNNGFRTKKALNGELIQLSGQYKEHLPSLLKPKIDSARRFFLESVVPFAISLNNGIEDGVEILKVSIDEEPDAGEVLAVLNQSIRNAMQAKVLTYVASHFELSPTELELYSFLNFYKMADAADLQALLKSMRESINEKEVPKLQQVSNVQRRKKNKGS